MLRLGVRLPVSDVQAHIIDKGVMCLCLCHNSSILSDQEWFNKHFRYRYTS